MNGETVEIAVCPVCDQAPSRVWRDDGKPTRYRRCLGCGLVYASPRASRAKRYAWLNQTFAVTESLRALTEARRPALKREAQIIHAYVSGGRMLDVGCSLGALFEFFPPPLWERWGVELSASAADYAAQVSGAHVHVGTLASADYPAQYFDLVTLVDTLYYLDDPAGELREIRRVLKPGGVAAVETPGQAYILWRNYGLVARLLDGVWSRAATDSSYIYWFTPWGLERLLRRCGLQPIGWQVVPSPTRANRWMKVLSEIHFRSLQLGARLFPVYALTWAPKYLCVARRV